MVFPLETALKNRTDICEGQSWLTFFVKRKVGEGRPSLPHFCQSRPWAQETGAQITTLLLPHFLSLCVPLFSIVSFIFTCFFFFFWFFDFSHFSFFCLFFIFSVFFFRVSIQHMGQPGADALLHCVMGHLGGRDVSTAVTYSAQCDSHASNASWTLNPGPQILLPTSLSRTNTFCGEDEASQHLFTTVRNHAQIVNGVGLRDAPLSLPSDLRLEDIHGHCHVSLRFGDALNVFSFAFSLFLNLCLFVLFFFPCFFVYNFVLFFKVFPNVRYFLSCLSISFLVIFWVIFIFGLFLLCSFFHLSSTFFVFFNRFPHIAIFFFVSCVLFCCLLSLLFFPFSLSFIFHFLHFFSCFHLPVTTPPPHRPHHTTPHHTTPHPTPWARNPQSHLDFTAFGMPAQILPTHFGFFVCFFPFSFSLLVFLSFLSFFFFVFFCPVLFHFVLSCLFVSRFLFCYVSSFSFLFRSHFFRVHFLTIFRVSPTSQFASSSCLWTRVGAKHPHCGFQKRFSTTNITPNQNSSGRLFSSLSLSAILQSFSFCCHLIFVNLFLIFFI